MAIMVVGGLAKRRRNDWALMHFLQMQRVGIEPNEMTFSVVVGVSCISGSVDFGWALHCLILKKGFSCQIFIASRLITMYSKWDHIEEARQVFDEMPERDVVSWNSMISGYGQNGLSREAISLFSLMLANDFNWKSLVNNFTVASVLKACSGWGCIKIGKSVHSYAIKLNFHSDVIVAGSTIDMYSKCGSLDWAGRVFDRMGKRDLIAWNAMISGYAQSSYAEEAIELFFRLQYAGLLPNQTTFTSILKGLAEVADVALGRSFHAKILKGGCPADVFVGTALLDMYSKCLDMEDAERAFEEMKIKNLVSFNVLITGYSLIERYEEALKSYIELRRGNMEPDEFTLSGLLSSCTVLGALSEGTEVHSHTIKFGLDSNVYVANSLVSLYSKCGYMDSALKAFESVAMPNVVSWAGIISAFVHNGEGENSLRYFHKMQMSCEKPDEFSFTSVLKVLAGWAVLEQGKHIHAYAIKMGLESAVFLGSVLIDMYSKCGIVEDSFKVFANMPEKNVVSWNSMIIAYAQNGMSQKSLCLFGDMKKIGLNPTCVTFIGVLLACSHAGLVDEGRCFYDMMIHDFGISPSLEHVACMVDLLGRARCLSEAETFLTNSPFSSESTIWRSLLAACRVHNYTDIGIRVAKQCLRLDPRDPATYVLLSDIYALKCSWAEVGRIRDLMRDIGVEKDPGCSWISIRNVTHVFVAEDARYSQKMSATLESLMVHLKTYSCVLDTIIAVHDAACAY
ncbi:pentatricopeptide repeat-containing protein At2g27610-like [Magnolia sinica]|uniref:pentatricopeptide repeat-containing protein At2g27610-like n=1 Tax=Magnolia sinica TaxID=86752 RepID=UPI00265A3E3C|nr:pentatricopeptide repeat-containing protein At2g27610-like [Magnolia sinica]